MLRWTTIRPFATFFTKSLKSDEAISSAAKSPNAREIVDSDGMLDCDSQPQSLRMDGQRRTSASASLVVGKFQTCFITNILNIASRLDGFLPLPHHPYLRAMRPSSTDSAMRTKSRWLSSSSPTSSSRKSKRLGCIVSQWFAKCSSVVRLMPIV